MGINIFGGVNLYEREDIDNNSSQWNSNCYYDKGQLRLQHFTVPKESIKSKIYERKYELADDIEVESPGTDFTLYEGQDYKTKGYLVFEHAGDGHDMWKHGIPKPTVRLHFDYNNDDEIPNHYHNILDLLYKYDEDKNDAHGVVNKDFYAAIVKNLEDSDMVAECEIGITYSGPYGESAMTYFKIANNMPYFFLEIVLFNELNDVKSYDRYKNIKYLNVYVKYEFMVDYMLLDRYDFEVTDTKENMSPGNRNRHERFDPNSDAGLDFRYPFIEFGEIDYPFLGGETQTTENVLWYFSGFFGYESDEKPALQWFIPNKLTANVPQIITEQQTYIADEDIEVIDDESYDKLKEFWDSDNAESDTDYDPGDDLIESVQYLNMYFEEDSGGEDTSRTEIITSKYKNNTILSADGDVLERRVYELSGSQNIYYIVRSEPTGPITLQLGQGGAKGQDGAMRNPDPSCQSVVFQKGNVNENREVLFDGQGDPTVDSVTFEIIINKYHEVGNKRIFIESINMSGTGVFFDFELQNCVFDEDDDSEQYIYQVWLNNTDLENSGWMLIQEVDYKSWKNYRDGDDEFYELENERYIYSSSDYKPFYNIQIKDNISYKVDTNDWYNGVYTKGNNHRHYTSYAKDGYDAASIFQRGRHQYLTAYSVDDIYRLYGSAAIYTGGGSVSQDGGFVSIAEFYEDSEGWKLYVGFNPSTVIRDELFSDFQEDIDQTIQAIEYNYDELLEIVQYGVAIECPNNFDDMYQKEIVSKHAVYMDRLFKSIVDDNGKSLLYFSEQSYPESFNQTSVFKFDDKIVHLETFKKQFYIFLPEEIQVLSGSNNLTFILDEYYTDGAYEYTVVKHENQLLFTNEKGIYSISPGSYPQLLSINIQMFFDESVLDIEYAEVLTSKGVDFYVLNLNESISPMDVSTIHANEFGMLLEKGTYNDEGTDWSFRNSEEFYNETNERFAINKIAVCLRDGSIWFGTENDSDEFLWKSAEFVQESFFKLKSFKRLILDFAGKVSTVFGKNRKVPVTFKRLPMPGAASALGESRKSTMKYTKDMPTDWAVEGQRSYSNSMIFLSEHKNTILYKWEVLESGYDDTNN